MEYKSPLEPFDLCYTEFGLCSKCTIIGKNWNSLKISFPHSSKNEEFFNSFFRKIIHCYVSKSNSHIIVMNIAAGKIRNIIEEYIGPSIDMDNIKCGNTETKRVFEICTHFIVKLLGNEVAKELHTQSFESESSFLEKMTEIIEKNSPSTYIRENEVNEYVTKYKIK